jgi:phosphoenolpyruvate-protein kinase (PTS system EI component)
LLGLGLDEFSMSPRAIPHAKAIIRQWTVEQAKLLAQEVLNLDSAEQVRQKVRDKKLT